MDKLTVEERSYINSMKKAPRFILPYYIRGLNFHGWSYSRIGKLLGISRQRVHQIVNGNITYQKEPLHG